MLKWSFRIVRRRVRRRPSSKKERREGLFIYGGEARKLIHSRLEYFNQFYNLKYQKVFIKSQTTRWGSCSARGNLNFNYKIVFLPSHLADYIIVHELCHLGEFNHSKRFWNLVAKIVPDYSKHRKELKEINMELLKQK